MDYRTDGFTRRFAESKLHLNANSVEEIVSFKFRRDVGHSEYLHLLEALADQRCGLSVDRLDGNFGGQAWLVKDRTDSRALLVEHETGLEILYIAGSIASLIGLVPLIASAWRHLRSWSFDRPGSLGGDSVEIRRLDKNGALVEEKLPSVEAHILKRAVQEHSALQRRVAELEADIALLKRRRLANPPKGRTPKPRKKGRKKR